MRPLLLGRDPQDVEDLRLQLGLVDPDRAAGELDRRCRRGRTRLRAPRPDRRRAAAPTPAVGRVNGWCVGRPAPVVLAPQSNIGKSRHPQRTARRPRRSGRARGRAGGAAAPSTRGDHARARRRRRAPSCPARAKGCELLLGEELRDRRARPRRPRRRRCTRAPSRPTPSRLLERLRARRARTPAARAGSGRPARPRRRRTPSRASSSVASSISSPKRRSGLSVP